MTFDPTAPTAEDIAFGAMLTLESPPADLPPEQVDIVRGTLETYAADRRGKGLPLFPNRTAQANSARADYLQKLYTQPIEKTLAADAVAKLEQRKAIHPDPEEFQSREVNRAFLSALTQRQLTAADYDLTRDAYARQELKLTGPVTDKAVYGAIQNRFKEDESTRAATSAKITEVIQRQLATIGVEGESIQNTATTTAGARKNLYQPPTTEEREAFLETIPERSRAAVREQWNDHTREISRLFRQHAPLVQEIAKAVELVKASDDPEKAIWKDIAGWTAKLPEGKRERGVVLAMLSNTLANNPNIDRGFLARITSKLARGVNRFAVSTLQAGQAESRQVLRGAGASTDVTEFTSDANTEFLTRARELAGVVQGSGMDLHAATDNFLQSSAIAAAESAWMIPAAFHPVGQLAIQQSLMGDSIQKAATENPDVPEGLRTNAAFASGAAQAALETLSNTTGVKIMLGKLPRFAGVLNKFGVQSPAGRAALGFVAGAATTGGIEYTEEALQGATDLMFQSLAADLAGQKPDVDWGGYFKEWATAAGPEQKETLLAVSAFGMIAGAGASFNHFKYGAALARNKTFLRAHGFTEAEVRDITNTTDLDEASRKAAAAFEEAQRRGPTLTEDDKARLETERKAAIEILKARNEAIAQTGTPVVTPETNTFTEETEWIFSDPATGMQSRHPSEESAFIAWRDWSRTQDETALDTLRETAETDFLETLTAEGAAGEAVVVKDSRSKEMTPAIVQAEALAEQKTAEQDLRKATTPAQTRAAREKREAATGRLAGLKARLDVLLFDEGLTPAQAGDVFRTAVIKARTFSTNVMGRLAGFTVELFRGANLQDITEEFAEANMRNAVEQGFADPEIILDDIRRYESATGARIIDPAYQYDPANQIPLIEGFSKLARGVLLSERSSAALPSTVAKWIGIQLAMESASIELARDLGTAAEFREALGKGVVPPRLERQLRDSIGLDPAAQQRRLEKKMEEQLAAEAMGGFPEISDELRGKLPHPETLRAEGHPLVGEVRRIWESLKKSTKRRSKDGRVIDRTNEANAYFLPIGTMEDIDRVRQVLNQKGFDFENPADMLDALDASISYGKPFYGTASMGGETFAMVRGVPKFSAAEAKQAVADGFTYGPVYRFGTPNFDDVSKTDPEARQGAGYYFWPKEYDALRALGAYAMPGAGGYRTEDVQGQGLEATLQDVIDDGAISVAYLKDPVLDGGEVFVKSPEQIRLPSMGGESFSMSLPSDADYLAAVKAGDMERAQQMVDEAAKNAGYNQKAYHGTWRAGFTVFKELTHFSPEKTYADRYQSTSASSMGISGVKEATDQNTYEVFLKMQKPFDTRKPKVRKMFNDEYLGKWGNGTPIQERGLPDWTDSIDLAEWLNEEHSGEFDSFILDEGAEPTESGEVAVRPSRLFR